MNSKFIQQRQKLKFIKQQSQSSLEKYYQQEQHFQAKIQSNFLNNTKKCPKYLIKHIIFCIHLLEKNRTQQKNNQKHYVWYYNRQISHHHKKKTFFYNVVSKQSNWGFSQNQRLLILNVQEKTLGYLSKIPQGYLPFDRYEEIVAIKQKEKINLSEANNFICTPIKGKISSMVIQWEDKEKTKHLWTFILGSSKLMNDWIGLITSVANNTFAKQKYDELTKINTNMVNASQNINNQVSKIQSNPINSLAQSNLTNNSQHVAGNNIKSLPSNSNVIANNLQGSKLSTDPKIQTSPVLGNSGLNNNNTNLGYSKTQSLPYVNEDANMKKKPYIPRLGQARKPTDQQIELQIKGSQPNINRPVESTITPKTLTSQASKYQEKNKASDLQDHNKHLLESKISQTKYYDQKSNIQLNKNMSGPSNLIGHSPKLESSRAIHEPEIHYQQQNNQPGDFVEELKRFRQQKPNKFDLTNDLSKKKFQQYNSANDVQAYNKNNSNQPTYKAQQNPQNRQSLERKPSTQKFLNKQNSGDKRLGYDRQYQESNFQRNKTNKSGLTYSEQFDIQGQRQNSKHSYNQAGQNKVVGNSSGIQNNYDQYETYENQIYKPSTNFPESTKNLSKIRSDFLLRKAQNNISQPYPQTSKNQSRMLGADLYERDHQKSRKSYNESTHQKASKHDSNQRKRQDSLNNLNKVNSTLMAKSTQVTKHWNSIWLQTSNPNKKIQIHQQFIQRSKHLIKQIVQQLPLPLKYRQYQPLSTKQNLHTYVIQSINITLHIFQNNQSVNGSEDNINLDAPVLYDQSSYDQLKREYYNYNLILGVTNNQGFIKVPLCCYFQYRGILAVCRADIPENYTQVETYTYKEQFEALQNIIKVRFLFGSYNIYQSNTHRGGQGKFIVLWNLKNLIPGIPNSLKNESSYFRKQFLLQYDEILQDLQSSSQAHAFTSRHIVPELLSKLQSLQIQLMHSKDLSRQLHKAGLSLSYLPQMFQQTNSIYLKRIFMSQIVAGIFTSIIRSQINHAFSILPAQNLQNINSQQLSDIIVDCVHVLINQLFSYSLRAESIWKIIVKQASKRYQIIVSKQDILPGYLLSTLVHKINLKCDFKIKSFNKTKSFFVNENSIPRQIFFSFDITIRRYDMEAICPTYSKCKEIIENQDPSTENYEHLVTILNLKSRNGFNDYYGPILQTLKTYLCNFIPYTEEREYENLDVYEYLYEEPITYNSIKTSFLAVKWLIKNNQVERANQIFEIKFHELGFWIGEYNPSITQFYDFFSMFYASIGDYQQSICLAKSSLINVHKVLGQHALPVADKHYQLGNIYFKIGRKNQALKQYNKTKQVLHNHQKTTIPEYGIILLKIALLCLNFGQLTECLANAIQAQRIFQNNGGNENEQIQCFQVLARVYEITKKSMDINNLCQACAKTFNNTQNPKILQRMLKIVLYPKLSSLSTQQQKSLTFILAKLQQHSHNTYVQAFNYLHKKASSHNLKKKLHQFLQNIVLLTDQVNRRDLIRKHQSMPSQASGEAEEMLAMFQSVGILVGFNYMIGAMKDTYYE